MRHIIPISGKDSLATAIIQRQLEPDLPYEYIFNETGTELPETRAWLEMVEKALAISIQRVGSDLIEQIHEMGFLPNHKQRFCTRVAKIKPMEEMIIGRKEEAKIYIGLRADEPGRSGYSSPNEDIEAIYPMRTVGMGIDGVYKLLYSHGLMPPTFFWPQLYEAVVAAVGTSWRANLEQWQFDKLFAGRSRANCYMCFYQQRAEWVWLLMTHPDLFAQAEELEQSVGSGDRRENTYYLIGQGFPLGRIRDNWRKYFNDRVSQTVRIVHATRQGRLFDDSLFVEIDAGRSCGLFCGK
jgi:hypothetical protein